MEPKNLRQIFYISSLSARAYTSLMSSSSVDKVRRTAGFGGSRGDWARAGTAFGRAGTAGTLYMAGLEDAGGLGGEAGGDIVCVWGEVVMEDFGASFGVESDANEGGASSRPTAPNVAILGIPCFTLGFVGALEPGAAGGALVGRAGRSGEVGGEMGAFVTGRLSSPVAYDECVTVELAAGSLNEFSSCLRLA